MSDKDKKPAATENATENVEAVDSASAESEQANEHAQQERVIEGEAEVLDTESASGDEKSWSMFAHLAAFVAMVPLIPVIGMVLGPLVVWLLKKESMPLVAENGKEALNFNISMFIAYCVALILCFILIGIPLLFGLIIFHFIVTILAAIKASEGGVYKYPFSLKLVQ
ncbi:DUF4870 domain-containing protein [Kangiella sp. TOML190]|uniref:DUF4870 domain-containing protein n=1 Tax=Kangiella sp. TOML190 TaxID=2931351 RepID=UPI00203E5888|nr:DUF4870 domain-containing protein [Kangiella sp. TOML190]